MGRVECSIQGHMSGVPYIKVRATESALAELLEASKQDIDFVEPDFKTRLIPKFPNEVLAFFSRPCSHAISFDGGRFLSACMVIPDSWHYYALFYPDRFL